jgi:hypothetical protein
LKIRNSRHGDAAHALGLCPLLFMRFLVSHPRK